MNFYLSSIIAWLYWDPPPVAFTVPLLDRPVFWYGILFISGFILGYFILVPILARFLKNSRHLSVIDVINWPHLIDTLRSSPSPFISQLKTFFDSSLRLQIKQKDFPSLTPALQQSILEGLNRFLQQTASSRDELQQIFADALASPKQTAYFLADRLSWFLITGTLIGARLGEVFFYDWSYFREYPLEIFKVWNGGLASHGGVLGVMIALYFYRLYIKRWVPQLTFIRLLDYVAIPSSLAACFIRLGNLMNQEILGTPTTLPWGIIFGHPADHSSPEPRHPVQLYETGAYLLTFFVLWRLWKVQRIDEKPGTLLGLLFVFIFGSRFILEYWKATQLSILTPSFIQMGQILSIPFIALGIFLVWRPKKYKDYSFCCTKNHSS